MYSRMASCSLYEPNERCGEPGLRLHRSLSPTSQQGVLRSCLCSLLIPCWSTGSCHTTSVPGVSQHPAQHEAPLSTESAPRPIPRLDNSSSCWAGDSVTQRVWLAPEEHKGTAQHPWEAAQGPFGHPGPSLVTPACSGHVATTSLLPRCCPHMAPVSDRATSPELCSSQKLLLP